MNCECETVRSGIYTITNKVNGKVYVGQAVDIPARWRSHRCELRNGKHGNPHLQNAWRKYGEENFEFSVLESVPVDKLNDAEIAWIKRLNTFRNGYNLTTGGGGQTGRLLTDEQKRHLSEINMGAKNPNYGLKRSEETRRKMSMSMRHKRKPLSDAHKKSISKGNKGKKKPWFDKPVAWAETGEVFRNVSEAAEKTGYSISGISKVCRGQRRAIYKQHFNFILEE